MSPRTLLITSAISVLLGNAAAARDDRGFRMGGGVGAVSCPDFLNAMATARKKGGLTSVAGLWKLLHTSIISLDSKLAIIPRRTGSMTSLNRSGMTMLLIAFCPSSSRGVRVILIKHSQSLCLPLRKAFEIN